MVSMRPSSYECMWEVANCYSIYSKHDLKVQQSWCGRVQLIKLELINYNKTNIKIRRIYNLCGLKEHLSDFLKASMSQIDLIWFSRASLRIIDLYEHAFLVISVPCLGNLKIIVLLK